MTKRNIEIKAACGDAERLRALVKQSGAEFICKMRQRDIYFEAGSGRVKLRIIDGKMAELIRYSRANQPGPKESSYSVQPVRFPGLLKLWLKWRRGILVEVSKVRELWLWQGVRIHIDKVKHLGNFIELEAVVDEIGSIVQAEQRCKSLIKELEIEEEKLVEVSYSDLLLAKGVETFH